MKYNLSIEKFIFVIGLFLYAKILHGMAEDPLVGALDDFKPKQVMSDVSSDSDEDSQDITASPVVRLSGSDDSPIPDDQAKRLTLDKMIKRLQGGRVVPRYSIGGTMIFTPQGIPSMEGLVHVVETLHPSQGELAIREESLGSNGNFVGKVVRVSDGKVLFYLKIAAPLEQVPGSSAVAKQPALKVASVQRSSVGRFAFEAQRDNPALLQSYPIIIGLDAIIQYRDQRNRLRNIELSPVAKGQSMLGLLDGSSSHLAGMVVDDTELKKMGFAVGKALGAFHAAHVKSIRKSVVHGDFHPDNVFVYQQKPLPGFPHFEPFYRVSFIDNESMSSTLQQGSSVTWDICAHIFIPLLFWRWADSNKMNDALFQRFCTYIASLLQGYESVFPPSQMTYVRAYVNNWIIQLIAMLDEMLLGKQQLLLPEASDFFKGGVITPDQEGNFWVTAMCLYRKIYPQLPQDFYNPHMITFNSFIKFLHRTNVVKMQQIKERLFTLKFFLNR